MLVQTWYHLNGNLVAMCGAPRLHFRVRVRRCKGVLDNAKMQRESNERTLLVQCEEHGDPADRP